MWVLSLLGGVKDSKIKEKRGILLSRSCNYCSFHFPKVEGERRRRKKVVRVARTGGRREEAMLS
jgi:hypothetical protein